MVIGYGTAKKSSLTSSVEVVSGEELTKIPAMNVDESLAGQIPGLGVMSNNGDPSSNAEASISIRGNNGSPLLVIDGVPRLGTNTGDGEMRLSDLNPDDIEAYLSLRMQPLRLFTERVRQMALSSCRQSAARMAAGRV